MCGVPEQGPGLPRPGCHTCPPSPMKWGRWSPSGDPRRGVTSRWPSFCGLQTLTLLGQLALGFPSKTRQVRGPHRSKSSKESRGQPTGEGGIDSLRDKGRADSPRGEGRDGGCRRQHSLDSGGWRARPGDSAVPSTPWCFWLSSSALRREAAIRPPTHPSVHSCHDYPLSSPGVPGTLNGSGGSCEPHGWTKSCPFIPGGSREA